MSLGKCHKDAKELEVCRVQAHRRTRYKMLSNPDELENSAPFLSNLTGAVSGVATRSDRQTGQWLMVGALVCRKFSLTGILTYPSDRIAEGLPNWMVQTCTANNDGQQSINSCARGSVTSISLRVEFERGILVLLIPAYWSGKKNLVPRLS
jgi:hypothetical protein